MAGREGRRRETGKEGEGDGNKEEREKGKRARDRLTDINRDRHTRALRETDGITK